MCMAWHLSFVSAVLLAYVPVWHNPSAARSTCAHAGPRATQYMRQIAMAIALIKLLLRSHVLDSCVSVTPLIPLCCPSGQAWSRSCTVPLNTLPPLFPQALQAIASELQSRPADIVMYVDRLDMYRTEPLDKAVFEAMTATFGPRVWDHTIIALTHGQMLSPPVGTTFGARRGWGNECTGMHAGLLGGICWLMGVFGMALVWQHVERDVCELPCHQEWTVLRVARATSTEKNVVTWGQDMFEQ